MKQAIDIRDMHTAIHNLFEVINNPDDVLSMFEALEEEGDRFKIEFLWDEINKNTKFIAEFNFRNIRENRTVTIWDEDYQILNPVAFDI